MTASRSSLAGKTLLITGATRGIGLAIALRAAKDGANIVLLGKTVDPHPHLPGTLREAEDAVRAAGGQALAVRCDVRSEEEVRQAVAAGVAQFSGIDVVVNNASAIQLTPTDKTEMKRFDLMHQVNVRGTFLTTQACLPHLKQAENPHILTLSPPLTLRAKDYAPHLAYSLAKLGMSYCTLAWAEELRPLGIAANSLWPRTIIDTSAVRNLLGGESVAKRGRSPEIVADAAHAILTREARSFSGNFVIDEQILLEEGVRDFSKYQQTREEDLLPDLFLPEEFS